MAERDHAGEDDRRGDGEPDAPAPDEVDTGLAVVEPRRTAAVAWSASRSRARRQRLSPSGTSAATPPRTPRSEPFGAAARAASSSSSIFAEQRVSSSVASTSRVRLSSSASSSSRRSSRRRHRRVAVGDVLVRWFAAVPAEPGRMRSGLMPCLAWRREAAGDAEVARLGEDAVPAEQDDERPGEDVRRHDVDERRDPEHEGEAAHGADRQQPQHERADERDRVGGKDRAVGAPEAPVDRGPDRTAGADLVL